MKKPREEIAEEIRFLQDAYWESLTDLDEAIERVLVAGGWTAKEWFDEVGESW